MIDQPFPGSTADLNAKLKATRLELAQQWERMQRENLALKDRVRTHEALITELCDALEEEYGSIRGDGHMSNLLIRARDAAKKH